MRSKSIDFKLLSEAIERLPIDTVRRIKNLCEVRVGRELSSKKQFKLPGKQAAALKRFFYDSVDNNLRNFLSMPRVLPFSDNSLPWLLMQDWGKMFDNHETKVSKRYCVYQHFMPLSGNIESISYFNSDFSCIKRDTFYIGKGIITRPYDFTNRSSEHKKHIKESMSKCKGNKNLIVNVIRKGLTEKQALELEAKLIFFFRPSYIPNGILSNLHFPGAPPLLEGLEFYDNGGIKDSEKNKRLLGEALSIKLL